MKKKLVIAISVLTISTLTTACNAKDNNLNVSAQTNPIVETTTQEETITVEKTSTVEETNTVEETSTVEETVASDPIPESKEVEQPEYTVETIDKHMYVKEWCNTYMGPDEKTYELFGECNKGELVHLTGQVKEIGNWYEYEVETGDRGFISDDYLVAENPIKSEQAKANAETTPSLSVDVALSTPETTTTGVQPLEIPEGATPDGAGGYYDVDLETGRSYHVTPNDPSKNYADAVEFGSSEWNPNLVGGNFGN